MIERTVDWTLGRLFRPLMSNLHCYFDDFGLLSAGSTPLCPICFSILHLLDLGAINLLPEVQSSPKFFTDWTLPQQFRLPKSNPLRNSSPFGPQRSNSASRSPIHHTILHLLDLSTVILLPEVQSTLQFFTFWTFPQQFCFPRSNLLLNSSLFGL